MHSISYIKASQLTWSLQCDIWHKKSLCESGIHRSFEKSLQLMKIFMENKSYIIYMKFMIVFLPTISWNKWGTAIWTVECSCLGCSWLDSGVQLSRQWNAAVQTVKCSCPDSGVWLSGQWSAAVWIVKCSCPGSVGLQRVRCRCKARCHLGSEAECQTGVTWGVKLGVTCSVELGVTLSVKPTQGLSMILTCY